MEHELKNAQQIIRALKRQAAKDQERYAELARAYQMTVANLVQATGECLALERERDQWRKRATTQSTETLFASGLTLTHGEIAAIRKAMARLHHPDAGGDADRMKLWNMLLDQMERGS